MGASYGLIMHTEKLKKLSNLFFFSWKWVGFILKFAQIAWELDIDLNLAVRWNRQLFNIGAFILEIMDIVAFNGQ